MAKREDMPHMPPFIRLMYLGQFAADTNVPEPPTRTLENRVVDDLGQITYDVPFGPAPPELPQSRDLSAYDVALAEARRTCPHEVVQQPLYSRPEVDCLDCGRHMPAAVYYRERRERS